MLNSGPPPPPSAAVWHTASPVQAWLGSVVLQYERQDPPVAPDWKHARPAPHVGEPAVFMQASPSLPGPALRHAKFVCVWGQQTWPAEHSHGFWLQGVEDEPPSPALLLLLEQAAATGATREINARRRARWDMRGL